jgi:hypothetical protein
LPWVSADDVFAAQDAEEDALRAAPWLLSGRGPLRKPEEGGFQTRVRKLTVEERPERGRRSKRYAKPDEMTMCFGSTAG